MQCTMLILGFNTKWLEILKKCQSIITLERSTQKYSSHFAVAKFDPLAKALDFFRLLTDQTLGTPSTAY